MIREHECVVLTEDILAKRLQAGDVVNVFSVRCGLARDLDIDLIRGLDP
jgi:hypothetical protein